MALPAATTGTARNWFPSLPAQDRLSQRARDADPVLAGAAQFYPRNAQLDYALRFGLLEIDEEDLTMLADAMGIGRLDRPINPSHRHAGRISRSAR